MKQISAPLAAHLAGRVTTLCACWILEQRDGSTFGFTDHDRAVTVETIVCAPGNGLGASAMTGGPGLATGGGEVAGALSGAAITERDLEAGFWDGAEIRTYLVNWADPSQVLLERRAKLGEVVREGNAFRAELRGLAHLLEAKAGRVFSRTCDADLGDPRCGVGLGSAAYTAEALVQPGSDLETLRLSGLDAFATRWFAGGRLRILDGGLSGFASEIADHRAEEGSAEILLWQTLPAALADGTRVTVSAGCDKRLETCAAKFANTENFRGFPHMPGTDFVLSYPNRNTGENDGGARV
ncbi:putative phage protein (TIGR02218 family) [Roseibium hamelinense]|uniref:Putative phage protein (TIGR02218 family) n=1 Tax=Roseibium hamelinense TaxID=150831 RepID=A0A562T8W2_9HYPH|nr:DUF2163 domain-containing protein [Roseibium hamelinense]MTI43704.1 DUF2163 domain-containing protein [Roseibium hamelinense]TWI89386.1 putative phage protein (TIGR02218 family) [Roseibium hamelinense]